MFDDPAFIVASLGFLTTIGVAFLNTRIEHRLTELEVKTAMIWDYHKSEIPLGLKNPSEFHGMLDMLSMDLNLITDFNVVDRTRLVNYLKSKAGEEATDIGVKARLFLKMIRVEVGDSVLASDQP